jgi:tRNA threonylcarbamoyladenosine biosynthesis protein TsaE
LIGRSSESRSSTSARGAAPRDARGPLVAATADELRRIGGVLALAYPPPRVVLLSGPLGAGKTTLVQGWLQALGVRDTVKSPSFDLVHRHRIAGGWAYHVDLYRLTPTPPPEELDVDLARPDDVVLVEWGGPWRACAPDRVEVRVEFGDGCARAVHVREVKGGGGDGPA